MKKFLSVLLAVAMLAALCVLYVNAEDVTIGYNVQVKEDGTQEWYFQTVIPNPKYEAGWILFDREGGELHFYGVDGWSWNDEGTYTILSTKLQNADQAADVYALAAAGKLYAAIVDVSTQGNDVVDASDCTTVKIFGDNGGVENLATDIWGEKEAAIARCNTVTLKKVILDAEGQSWIFSGYLLNGYEAGWQLVDDEGNFYTISGWTWDHSKGYTVLHTVCSNQEAAIAKADEGKLTAGIVDVSGKLEDLVAANDSWTLVKGGLSTEIASATEMWGEKLVASARAITDKTPDAPAKTGDALIAVVAVVVAAAAGVVLMKKH